jgi:hypothetical protein
VKPLRLQPHLPANPVSRREYAVVDRAGFANEASPLKLGTCNKTNNFGHVRSIDVVSAADTPANRDAIMAPA